MVWHSLKHKVVILTTLSLIGASSLPVITTREVIAQTISVQSQSQALSQENQSQSFVSQADTRKREKRDNPKGNTQSDRDHKKPVRRVIGTPRRRNRPIICRIRFVRSFLRRQCS